MEIKCWYCRDRCKVIHWHRSDGTAGGVGRGPEGVGPDDETSDEETSYEQQCEKMEKNMMCIGCILQ